MGNPTGHDTAPTKATPPKVEQPARDFVPPEKDLRDTGKDGAADSKKAPGQTAPIPEVKKA